MKNILLLLCVLAFISCNNSTKTAGAKADDQTAAGPLQKLLGSFVGVFGDNKITLLITRAENGKVEGRSVVGGNDRVFSGTIEENRGIYSISAKEPGDDPNDGQFEFEIDSHDPDIITGSWKPFNTNKVAKSYTLQRKAFTYRMDVGDYPEASQRELKPEDVENMMKPELQWMRNEIFARHGYCFRKKDLRDYFEDRDWYVPDNVDIRNKLTTVEIKNLALIKRYEQYAEDYGDEYGR